MHLCVLVCFCVILDTSAAAFYDTLARNPHHLLLSKIIDSHGACGPRNPKSRTPNSLHSALIPPFPALSCARGIQSQLFCDYPAANNLDRARHSVHALSIPGSTPARVWWNAPRVPPLRGTWPETLDDFGASGVFRKARKTAPRANPFPRHPDTWPSFKYMTVANKPDLILSKHSKPDKQFPK